MYGRATAAMEVSSTSMNVASITATAISHGLIGAGALCVVCAGVIPFFFQRREQVACKDAPSTIEVEKIVMPSRVASSSAGILPAVAAADPFLRTYIANEKRVPHFWSILPEVGIDAAAIARREE